MFLSPVIGLLSDGVHLFCVALIWISVSCCEVMSCFLLLSPSLDFCVSNCFLVQLSVLDPWPFPSFLIMYYHCLTLTVRQGWKEAAWESRANVTQTGLEKTHKKIKMVKMKLQKKATYKDSIFRCNSRTADQHCKRNKKLTSLSLLLGKINPQYHNVKLFIN